MAEPQGREDGLAGDGGREGRRGCPDTDGIGRPGVSGVGVMDGTGVAVEVEVGEGVGVSVGGVGASAGRDGGGRGGRRGLLAWRRAVAADRPVSSATLEGMASATRPA